ncbi:AraC family transcriptional regulator [Dyadobacter sp. CY323]|uniref:AraC family transcriptional regulator n=1 Tax=Dyadobacter sp. CY323 TaxID=2907302 RepID=UPI001F3AED72|nr:AraC family transcriptional regulator [Dyadobacter sp. CY323]MCE6989702.1 AraC family transcriptional regulator [Dyadobacter sp. CY323]
MKPVLMRHVATPPDDSFKSWENAGPYLHNPWHYHPECEITYVNKGSGVLFIGDQVLNYKQDTLIMIGPNLPHEWRSDSKENPDFHSQTFAVHFNKNFPGAEFYKIPEAAAVNHLLEQSVRGIQINDAKTKSIVKDKLMQLLNTKGLERISLLFSIFNNIVSCEEIELLSSLIFVNSIDEGQNHRMNKIYKYVMDHFRDQISVEEIACEVHMTTTSFCRFFKQRTNKSFIQYVNDIRIGYACKLLLQEDYNISQIAYESGFENLSNFNKQFKKIKNLTPRQFILNFEGKK